MTFSLTKEMNMCRSSVLWKYSPVWLLKIGEMSTTLLQLTKTNHYMFLLSWYEQPVNVRWMVSFIIASISRQTTLYDHVGGFRELIFPGVLRKTRRFSFRHNSIPVQSKAPTGQSGLDCSQTATVTFSVCRQQHSLFLLEMLSNVHIETPVLCSSLYTD